MTNLESMTPIDLDEQIAIDGGGLPLVLGFVAVICIFADPSVTLSWGNASMNVSC